MALTKPMTLTDNFGEGVEFPNCYIRVHRLDYLKTSAVAHVSMLREKDGQKLEDRIYPFLVSLADSDGSFVTQAYQHLKSLPEFACAEDC